MLLFWVNQTHSSSESFSDWLRYCEMGGGGGGIPPSFTPIGRQIALFLICIKCKVFFFPFCLLLPEITSSHSKWLTNVDLTFLYVYFYKEKM